MEQTAICAVQKLQWTLMLMTRVKTQEVRAREITPPNVYKQIP
jgi:hypothetical protein